MRKLFIALVLLTSAALIYSGVYASDVDSSTQEAYVPLGGGAVMTIGDIVISADSYDNGYLVIEARDVGLTSISHLFLQQYLVTSGNKYQGAYLMSIEQSADTAMTL